MPSQIDQDLLARFHRRFGAIDAQVGDPPPFSRAHFEQRRSPSRFLVVVLGISGLVVVMAAFGPLGFPIVAQLGTGASVAPSSKVAVSAVPAQYDGSPPQSIVEWLSVNTDIGYRPLTDEELRSVAISRQQAEATALRAPGFGYGPSSSTIAWTKVGCVDLGYFRAPHQPRKDYVPPEFPAYLVQTIGSPVDGFPYLNIGLEVIDARTGAVGPTFGFADGPILGSTCGTAP
jgi:hypothetical protein